MRVQPAVFWLPGDRLLRLPKGGTHMAVKAETADATAIRPFTIETPEADLDDLRARIAATRARRSSRYA